MANYSGLIMNLTEAATQAVAEKARQLQAKGIDVVNLGTGDPDFTTPGHIIDAAAKAMKDGHTHYVASRGIPAFREAIAKKLYEDNGLKFDPACDIVVTTGARMGIYALILSLVNPGDEVMILEPAWVSYPPIVQLAGAKPIAVSLDVNDNYKVTEEVLKKHITSKTRAVIVNSPNNPTGMVMTMAEWEALSRALKGTDIVVISDEVYEKLLFDGNKHISAATVPGLENRTVTVNGFSKSYAMCGWRLGYVAGDKELMSLVMKVQQQVSTYAPSFAQYAGMAALNGPQDCVEEMRQTYNTRRIDLVKGLSAIEGLICPDPQGAFYCFVNFEGCKDSTKLADDILEKVAVACVPGVAFGDAGEGSLRLTLAASTESLKKVPERIAKYMKEFYGKN